jgi:hypothetical protein
MFQIKLEVSSEIFVENNTMLKNLGFIVIYTRLLTVSSTKRCYLTLQNIYVELIFFTLDKTTSSRF